MVTQTQAFLKRQSVLMSTMLKVLTFLAEVARSDPFRSTDVCGAYAFYPLFSVTDVAFPYVQYEFIFL